MTNGIDFLPYDAGKAFSSMKYNPGDYMKFVESSYEWLLSHGIRLGPSVHDSFVVEMLEHPKDTKKYEAVMKQLQRHYKLRKEMFGDNVPHSKYWEFVKIQKSKEDLKIFSKIGSKK